MKTWHVIVLAASIIVAAMGAALVRGLCERYELVSTPSPYLCYRVDRLTGHVLKVGTNDVGRYP
jgi:hypothetical protein